VYTPSGKSIFTSTLEAIYTIIMTIEYTWDERKRLTNLEAHGLDFRDAWQVYEHPDKVTIHSSYPDEPHMIDMAEVNGRVRFREGRGYQNRMNAVLKAYVDAQLAKENQ
jgi:hypothetical protein